MSFEWDGRPDGEERLSNELFAAVGRPAPDLTEGEHRPRTVGSAVARRNGALLGWAWVFEEEPAGARAAHVQALYVPREARRIETGHSDLLPPSAEESEMVEGLYRRAAQEARTAGYLLLRWSGPDTGPDGQAATALDAHGHSEYARTWSVRPATWRPPADLPEVQIRQPAAPSLTLATSDAEVSAGIYGTAAHINAGESIHHQNADPRAVAALIVELVSRLKRNHPQVTELTIWEFDDATELRQALSLAGLHITARHMKYEFPLTSA
ncbi:hypothetical protein GCM10009612_53840 [Streptomyces beijiangensis]